MDGRTRVSNAIVRQPLDRVPRCDSLWEDTLTAWRQQGFPADADPADYFAWDIQTMSIDASPRLEQRVLEEDGTYITYQDRSGYTVRKAIGKSRALEFKDYVTKNRGVWEELKGRFALDPSDSSRIDVASYFMHMEPYPSWQEAKALYDGLRRSGKYLAFVVYGPWEATWRHRGYERLLEDLLTDPDWARDMAETHVRLVLDCVAYAVRMGMKPDALYLVDDIAGQRGPLFSPEIWRQLFKPLYHEIGRRVHEQGLSLWLHCCGNCETYLPDFIECGVDVIQPLQASAGMDVRRLKAIYGDSLTFFGNIDVRAMSGSIETCEEEMRTKLLCAKQGGGYIFHSDHSVPPEVSFGQYCRVMELLDKYGYYDE